MLLKIILIILPINLNIIFYVLILLIVNTLFLLLNLVSFDEYWNILANYKIDKYY